MLVFSLNGWIAVERPDRTRKAGLVIPENSGALRAHAHTKIECRAEHAMAPKGQLEHALRQEDGLAFAQKLGLVASRKDQARNDGDTDGQAAGVENTQLGQEDEIAHALVIHLVADVVIAAVGNAVGHAVGSAWIRGQALSIGDPDRQGDAKLQTDVVGGNKSDRPLQGGGQQELHGQGVGLRRAVVVLRTGVQHERLPRAGRDHSE
jgi:hypothetical protein